MNRSAPEGWPTITPRIVVEDAKGFVEFISHVFEIEGSYDPATPSILELAESKLMISEAGPRDSAQAFLYVYVRDVESVYRRAIERGASSIEEPFNTPYGDRRAMVMDSWGNRWQFASPFRLP